MASLQSGSLCVVVVLLVLLLPPWEEEATACAILHAVQKRAGVNVKQRLHGSQQERPEQHHEHSAMPFWMKNYLFVGMASRPEPFMHVVCVGKSGAIETKLVAREMFVSSTPLE